MCEECGCQAGETCDCDCHSDDGTVSAAVTAGTLSGATRPRRKRSPIWKATSWT